eukprot:683358-Pyramimonas_sp.AAC.1
MRALAPMRRMSSTRGNLWSCRTLAISVHQDLTTAFGVILPCGEWAKNTSRANFPARMATSKYPGSDGNSSI